MSLFIWLLISVGSALFAAYIAELQNRRMWLWALLTFLFSPLVILLLLALPKVRPRKACPDCREMILAEANVCRYCGYRYAQPRSPGRGTAGNTATG